MTTYPEAYIDYLVYFHAERDFFECHEVMEEYWKQHREDPLSRAYVGLIQVAVGMYHHRRRNITGAVKMLESAVKLLTDEDMQELGIEAASFKEALLERINQLRTAPDAAYADIDIPLRDEQLRRLCLQRCERHKLQWGAPSNMEDGYLIHKHSLRDRSEVIEARAEQLKMQQKRG
ncbi:DUF309 domain-containing protein [Paenibacillus hamazuiensis]|uniref:DUF309 domain-containing protein n=1 Tax=Paenibacillus hamazuiensis TaxID=2936508 RepID=UPI00200E457B|nr:DUF309 domain-containing protein [Paenibacillus hamazuiensis]